jgi:hypothetical protein
VTKSVTKAHTNATLHFQEIRNVGAISPFPIHTSWRLRVASRKIGTIQRRLAWPRSDLFWYSNRQNGYLGNGPKKISMSYTTMTSFSGVADRKVHDIYFAFIKYGWHAAAPFQRIAYISIIKADIYRGKILNSIFKLRSTILFFSVACHRNQLRSRKPSHGSVGA